jgi:hypothetical protein
MRIRLTELRKLIREELARKILFEKSIEGEDELIDDYEENTEDIIPKKELVDLGINVDPELDYHVVYGRIVGQDDGDDQKYWDQYNDEWEEITDNQSNHPRQRHFPDKRANTY